MTLTEMDEDGKLFVGGLSWETTQEKLSSYFGNYGEVVDSVVMKNLATGRSRGFGFVTFADPGTVQAVLSSGPHRLDGKTIDPKACTPRSQQKGRGGSIAKLFLGGLPPNVTETDLRQAFSQFGKVLDVNIMYDQDKRKCRGFGFLSFESEDATHQACAQHYVDVNGKQIECKLAVPRDSSRRGPPHQQQHYGQGNSWNRMMPQHGGWPPMPPMNAPAPPSAPYGGWAGTQAPPQQQQGYSANGTAAGSYQVNYQGYCPPPSYSGYNTMAPAAYNQQAYSTYSASTTEAVSAPEASSVPANTTNVASTTDYSSAYGSGSGGQPVRSYTQQQQPAYHPYRR